MYSHFSLSNVSKTAKSAGHGFVLGIVILPIFVLIYTYLFLTIESLLAIHIGSGLIWFLLVIGSPIISLLDYSERLPQLQNKICTNIPRLSFTAFTFGFITVISGSMLYLNPSLSGARVGLWRTLALLFAWFIFFVGLFGPNRLHLAAYYERIKDKSDEERISRLNRYNVFVGLFEATLITIFVIAMNFV